MGLEEEALLDDIRLCVILKAQCSSGVAVLVYRGERNAAGGERVGERNVMAKIYCGRRGSCHGRGKRRKCCRRLTEAGSVLQIAGVRGA